MLPISFDDVNVTIMMTEYKRVNMHVNKLQFGHKMASGSSQEMTKLDMKLLSLFKKSKSDVLQSQIDS